MPSAKTLDEHVADQSWRARVAHHRELLETSPAPASERLGQLQARYRSTQNEYERRHIAVLFEKAMREPDPEEEAAREAEQEKFERELADVDEIDLDQLAAELDRDMRRQLARDLRSGSITGRPCTFRKIAAELRVSASTARRLAGFDRRS